MRSSAQSRSRCCCDSIVFMPTNIRIIPELDADVIVVGAGPAGCATAIHLAHAGIKVLILECAQFPRDKICGDFIGPVGLMELKKLGISSSHYRSREEEYQFALDYSFMKMLSLRGGYITGRDEQGFTFGMGITYKDYLSFDYAYIPFGIWDKSTRLTVRFSL